MSCTTKTGPNNFCVVFFFFAIASCIVLLNRNYLQCADTINKPTIRLICNDKNMHMRHYYFLCCCDQNRKAVFLAFTMNLLLLNQLILCVPVAFLMPFWFVPKSCHMVLYTVQCTSAWAWAWAWAHAFMESECVKLDYINFLWNRILFHASHESLMFPSR